MKPTLHCAPDRRPVPDRKSITGFSIAAFHSTGADGLGVVMVRLPSWSRCFANPGILAARPSWDGPTALSKDCTGPCPCKPMSHSGWIARRRDLKPDFNRRQRPRRAARSGTHHCRLDDPDGLRGYFRMLNDGASGGGVMPCARSGADHGGGAPAFKTSPRPMSKQRLYPIAPPRPTE
jgi:hypothetical protein